MLSTESVWSRRGIAQDQMSAGQYNVVIGLVLTWGFAINWYMVTQIDPTVFLSIPSMGFMIGYFVCIIAGAMMYAKSDNPAISFAGYNLIVLPLGVLLARFLPFVPAEVIGQAFQATAGVTIVMTAAASLAPRFFLSLGPALFIAFITAFLVQLGFILFAGRSPAIFDWIFVFLFSGYIGYDWSRAQHLPKTLDNAVDAAAALYVDIVLLFINLIQIFMGGRDD